MVLTTPWERRGAVWARMSDSDALLSPQSPTSFLRGFTYGLNPLRGCPFGCRDCYVQDLYPVISSRDVLPDGQQTSSPSAWGNWIEERRRAPITLEKALDAGRLDGARLFMSPLSDVYWPGTRRLARELLRRLAEKPVFEWLLISTRSPLVADDEDIRLFEQLGSKVEIAISIPTDREDVRAALARRNPSLERRFEAARRLRRAGISTRVHVAPLEPHSPAFPERLADAGHWVWIDWHQHLKAGFAADYARRGWRVSSRSDAEALSESVGSLVGSGRVRTGQRHFADRWCATSQSVVDPGPARQPP